MQKQIFELVFSRWRNYCFSKSPDIGLKSVVKIVFMSLNSSETHEVAKACENFGVVRAKAASKLIILCDHATNLLPPEYGTLGLRLADLKRHIAYDIGALPVAREVAARLDATLLFSRFSRLLIDPNRGEDDPTLIMKLSDGAIIPGNATVDEDEKGRRIRFFFEPYHAAIASEIDRILGRAATPIIVSIHSFTEAWRGMPRKWSAAVLWDKDPRLALPLLAELRNRTGLEIGDNEPYSGHLRNDTIFRHATSRGLPNALVEIRQDLIREEEGQRIWANIVADCLAAVIADPANREALSRIEYHGSYTDIEEERRN